MNRRIRDRVDGADQQPGAEPRESLEGGAGARSSRRDTVVLAAGSALNGLLAYLVFALSTRALGAEAAAPVSVLWSYWGFAGAALTFPLQHWIARTVTAHGEGVVRRALPRLGLVLVGICVVAGGVAWLGREALFQDEGVWWPVLTALLTLGSSAIGVVRGGLNARGHYPALAASLVSENGLRCVAVGCLFVMGVASPVGYGFCLVAGHLVTFGWLRAARFADGPADEAHEGPFAFLTGAGLGQLLGQVVLTGSPVLLAVVGGAPAQVTALFATLALFRAPYLLALGLVSQLTTAMTRLVIRGEQRVLRRIRRSLLAAALGGTALAALVGAVVGPPLLRLIFGGSVDFDAEVCAAVAAACTLAVANLVAMVSALAHNRPKWVAAGWAVAMAAAAVVYAVLSGWQPKGQIVACFLAAELAAFLVLFAVDVRSATRRPVSGPA